MFDRNLKSKLIDSFAKFPVVAVCGPRQSGKTTLAKQTFPHLSYVNLEDPSLLSMVKEDPKGFLRRNSAGLIIDEAQNFPELFSYIQVHSDEQNRSGQYILTGSQQFLLNAKISQSLAGRISILNLLPLAFTEIAAKVSKPVELLDIIFKGFYPRIYQYNIEPEEFYSNYIQTYVERDLRQLQNISDLSLFQKFMRLCANRIGQILNASSIAIECGVSHATIMRWLSLLEASYIVYLLKPYYANFNKRIIKSPKIYFYDTGLACHLLNITSSAQIDNHFAKGPLFENYILSEMLKYYFNKGKSANLYYIRNKTGHEVDFVFEKNAQVVLLEAKSGETISPAFFTNLNYWHEQIPTAISYLVYAGTKPAMPNYKGIEIISWQDVYGVL